MKKHTTAELGDLGEALVAQLTLSKLNSDRWDETCDMIDPHGRTVEVKTQMPHPITHMVSVSGGNENDAHKCRNVDRLIFVVFYPNNSWIKILELKPKEDFERLGNPYTTSRGVKMVGFHQDSLKQLATLTFCKDLSDKMKELSRDFRNK